MPITSNNTSAGNLTNFAAIGVGRFFYTSAEKSCLKLDSDSFKRLSDGAVFTGADPASECVEVEDSEGANLVFAAGATLGSLGNGGWFRHLTDGNCVKLTNDNYKRLNDGAIFTGADPGMEVIAKSESEVNGTYDP